MQDGARVRAALSRKVSAPSQQCWVSGLRVLAVGKALHPVGTDSVLLWEVSQPTTPQMPLLDATESSTTKRPIVQVSVFSASERSILLCDKARLIVQGKGRKQDPQGTAPGASPLPPCVWRVDTHGHVRTGFHSKNGP